MASSPRRRIPLVTVVPRIDGAPNPVGPTSPPRALASATDARTTRFGRPQRPRQRFDKPCAVCRSFGGGVEASFVRALTHRSQAKPALRSPIAPDAAASTASQPAFVTISSRPSFGWDGRIFEVIWLAGEVDYFLREGWTGQIRLRLQGKLGSGAHRAWLLIFWNPSDSLWHR
jgi:hypothetical protein